MDWERSRLSHHLGRMEKRGLIAREDCATDNRGAEVLMTPSGAEAFTGATLPHMRVIKQHFADALTPSQFDSLSDALRSINEHLS
jgi:DNA-binding MarR family transcriptional regulator